MDSKVFERATKLNNRITRLNEIIDKVTEDRAVRINGKVFEVSGYVGAAVLDALNEQRAQLIEEFDAL